MDTTKRSSMRMICGLGIVILVVVVTSSCSQPGATSPLWGSVTSTDGKVMEGVLVTVRGEGQNHAVTVVSNAEGIYGFPDGLESGSYQLSVLAEGWDLADPSAVAVEVRPGTEHNLKLKAKPVTKAELRPTEFLMSFPGEDRVKESFALACNSCHDGVGRAMVLSDAPLSEAHWESIIGRMKEMNAPDTRGKFAEEKKMAQLLARASAEGPAATYKLLPRPSGVATRAVITEWDIPYRNAVPHDVITDSHGNAWFADFYQNIVGKLDPRTSEFKIYRLPGPEGELPPCRIQGPEYAVSNHRIAGQPCPGTLDMIFDKEENLWIAFLFKGRVVRFNPSTEKFTFFDTGAARVTMVRMGLNGEVWFRGRRPGWDGIGRLHPDTGKVDRFPLPPGIFVYGIEVTSDGTVVFADINNAQVGTLNPKTGEYTVYPTPTPHSGPRRGNLDNEENFWFGLFGVHRVGKFNPRTGEITEYKLPTPFSGPYEVFYDRKTNMVWGSQFYADQAYRLDPRTGDVVEFRLPTRDTQTRRTWVDHSTNPPGVWYPVMARGKIGRLQLQE